MRGDRANLTIYTLTESSTHIMVEWNDILIFTVRGSVFSLSIGGILVWQSGSIFEDEYEDSDASS